MLRWKAIKTTFTPKPFNRGFATNTYHEIYAFGEGVSGQLGTETPTNSFSPALISALTKEGTNPNLGVKPQNYRFIDVRGGWCNSFAVTESLQVFGWGKNENGQLCLSSVQPGRIINEPTLITPLKALKIFNVACGRAHTCFLATDHRVYSVGECENGQLGTGNKINQVLPQWVKSLKGQKIMMLESGMDHVLALSEEGKVWAWGSSQDGQTGLGHYNEVIQPTELTLVPQDRIARISTGFDHSSLLTERGQVYTFGNNDVGQLGIGSQMDTSNAPHLVEDLEHKFVTNVACGGNHTLVLTEDKQVLGWGINQNGELGIGEPKPEDIRQSLPVVISALDGKGVSQIACGGGTSFAITEAGDLYAWGFNTHGRLGLGDEGTRFKPTLVPFFQDKRVLFVAPALNHTLVVVER